MEKLKKKFESLNAKYNSKKDFFRRTIDKWSMNSDTVLYKKGQILFNELQVLSRELQECLVATVELQPNEQLIKEKLKLFKLTYKQLNELAKPAWRQWVEAILVAGSLVFVLRTYIFGLYHVPTGSAEPTILVGDRLWGNKMCYYFDKVKRGDSVIFDNPEFIFDNANSINYYWQKYIGLPIPILGLGSGPDNWVKRVIAIPGDVLEGRIEDEKTVIYRNGKKIDETSHVNPFPLIKLIKTTGFIPLKTFGPIVIPGFLRKEGRVVDYTYDPEKSFADQPYYYMKEDEVARRNNGQPILRLPYSPSYEFNAGFNDFSKSIDSFGPIRIPEGKYWVMGDSRKNSKDSRYWGFLDQDLIHGRASFVIYSVDSEEPLWIFELLKHPIDFWTKNVRWDRFFKFLK